MRRHAFNGEINSSLLACSMAVFRRKLNRLTRPAHIGRRFSKVLATTKDGRRNGGARGRHGDPQLDVPKVDVVFEVKRDGRAFGRLRVSKGGVEWMQKNDKKTAFHMSWERVDERFVQSDNKGQTHSKKGRKK